jgi:hypothetical protein
MLKMCTTVLLATLCCISMASAHGGGAALMPSTNFTDMPSYSPERVTPVRLPRAKHRHWQQGVARSR